MTRHHTTRSLHDWIKSRTNTPTKTQWGRGSRCQGNLDQRIYRRSPSQKSEEGTYLPKSGVGSMRKRISSKNEKKWGTLGFRTGVTGPESGHKVEVVDQTYRKGENQVPIQTEKKFRPRQTKK